MLSLLGAFDRQAGGPQRAADKMTTTTVGSYRGRLRLLTWNIGNGDLESETRAHTDDLPAVAQVILDNDADAVALQELTGEEQLNFCWRT